MSWEFSSDVNYFVFDGFHDVPTASTGIDLCYIDNPNLDLLIQHYS